jgi:phage shock protein E
MRLALALLVAACATDTTSLEAHRLVERGALLLDVRTAAEFAERRLPNSLNLPVEQLQKRLSELPRTRPLVVYCHTGVRAGFATHILRKAGFEVHNLGTLARWYHDPDSQ